MSTVSPRHGLPTGAWPTMVAVTLATIGLALLVTSLLVWTSQGFPLLPQSFSRTPLAVVPGQLTAAVFIIVGTLLAHRLPRHAVGWLLLFVGLALTPILPTALLVAKALETFRPASELVRIAAWFTSSLTTPIALGCLALAGLLFPDGRLPSDRLRWAPVLIVAAAVMFGAAIAFDPVGLVWYPTIANPFAAPAAMTPVFEVARAATALALLAALGTMVAAITRRYRSGDAIVRAQLRWIMLATAFGGFLSVLFIVTRHIVAVSDEVGQVFAAAVFVGMSGIPLAAAFAITRYRLFGIDRLISRTLVYVPLVGVLGGLYAAAVFLFQRLFVAITGEPSEAPLLMAVFIIAAAFTPVRKTMEGTVDRWARAGQLATAGAGAAAAGQTAAGQTATTAPQRRTEPTAAIGEPISSLAWSMADAGSGAADAGHSTATVAAVQRLGARLTAGGGPVSDGTEQSLAIGADGTVDCPDGSTVPFTRCLGCPYLHAVTTSPPEVWCRWQGTAQASAS